MGQRRKRCPFGRILLCAGLGLLFLLLCPFRLLLFLLAVLLILLGLCGAGRG